MCENYYDLERTVSSEEAKQLLQLAEQFSDFRPYQAAATLQDTAQEITASDNGLSHLPSGEQNNQTPTRTQENRL